MTNKTIEILMFLLGYLKEHNFDDESLSDFSENLVVNGYNENDVAEALGLLLEKHSLASMKPSEVSTRRQTSVRMLSEYERIKVTPDVYGYLLRLHSLNIIDGTQMERIIDYCMFIEQERLNEEEINEIVATVLFEDADETNDNGRMGNG